MRCEIQFEKLKNAVLLTEKLPDADHPPGPFLYLDRNKKEQRDHKIDQLGVGIEVSVPVKSDTDGVFAVPAIPYLLF